MMDARARPTMTKAAATDANDAIISKLSNITPQPTLSYSPGDTFRVILVAGPRPGKGGHRTTEEGGSLMRPRWMDGCRSRHTSHRIRRCTHFLGNFTHSEENPLSLSRTCVAGGTSVCKLYPGHRRRQQNFERKRERETLSLSRSLSLSPSLSSLHDLASRRSTHARRAVPSRTVALVGLALGVDRNRQIENPGSGFPPQH